ncbi:tail fiber protein [Xanthomonas phage Xaa_vB_phi31]|uniref:Tail fiber protein n=1 Tax=Xanthomonas phage Xaa_vB_phi31 TaxID=2776752 RepID=A0A868BZR7_9CAUD|nr:tail fiber protein [Xanthomonas phage Xaa_vB_phi31]
MKITLGAKGRFKVQVLRADGSVRLDRPWQDNLITNFGMDYMTGRYRDTIGSSEFMYYCRVGTGTSTPAVGDVQLGNQIGVRDWTSQNNPAPVAAAAEPYASAIRVYAFNRGAVVGNLTELGLSMQQTGSNLCTRALFLDANGQPVTIVVAADEQLIVTYEVRMYIPTTPTTSTVTDPTTGIEYTIRALPCNAVSWIWMNYLLGGQLGAQPNLISNITTYGYSGPTAELREWHNTPLGVENSGGCDYQSFPVTDGTYARDSVITFRLDAFNGVDIKIVRLTESSPSYFAVVFRPVQLEV